MTCPDIEDLLAGNPVARKHSETCPECAARLELVAQVQEALNPEIETPERVVQETLTRLDEERRRRGPWEILATLFLAAATAIPIVVWGVGQSGETNPHPLPLALLVVAASLLAIAFEPRVVRPN